MRMLWMLLPCWRAMVAWCVALLTPHGLLKEMAEIPYVGAPVRLTHTGRIHPVPARTLRVAARNRRRLAKAMEHDIS